MLSPICDSTRLVLGFIATLGSIVFAAMASVLSTDVKNLYGSLSRRALPEKPARTASTAGKVKKGLEWALLVTSLVTTLLLGPYVAAVPSRTCVDLVISELICNPPGDDVPGERVTLENRGNRQITLDGRTLCDYQSVHCY
jgi:hypothetical protein